MNNREQEEPKKCSCPYCPGHGEHYGAMELQLEQVQDQQMTLDEWLHKFYPGVTFTNPPQGRGYIPK